MNPDRFWFAVLALVGFVIVVPGWLHFAGPRSAGLPGETQFLIAFMLPLALLLTLASWVEA